MKLGENPALGANVRTDKPWPVWSCRRRSLTWVWLVLSSMAYLWSLWLTWPSLHCTGVDKHMVVLQPQKGCSRCAVTAGTLESSSTLDEKLYDCPSKAPDGKCYGALGGPLLLSIAVQGKHDVLAAPRGRARDTAGWLRACMP